MKSPVQAPIADAFRQPPCPYCAGNRGIEYVTVPGNLVQAGVSGVVSFAGQVGGEIYVVVRDRNGVLVTHGYLSEAHVHTGESVTVGDEIGRVNERLYFGVRIDGQYVDPMRCMSEGTVIARRAILISAPPRRTAWSTR
ncbi:MAG: M23 family metallopeptidase [Ilumatobacteraceae bacterium]